MALSTPFESPVPGSLLHGPTWQPSPGKQKQDRCSLARLIFGLSQARFTGAIRVVAPPDTQGQYALYMRDGRVLHVRPPTLDEPLGHILHSMGLLDRETYARSLLQMAEERLRHGTVLKKMGVVNDEQIIGALSIQILRRTAAMFRLRDGRYAIDPIDHEYGAEGEAASVGVGVRRVIYRGVMVGYAEEDLRWELSLLQGRRVRLRLEEARRLGRYGFGSEAKAVLQVLSRGFVDLKSLSEGPAGSDLKVIYTLLVTEMLEVEPIETSAGDSSRPVIARPVAEPRPFAVPAAKGASLETLERLREARRTGQPRPFGDDPDPRLIEAKNRYIRGEAYLRSGKIDMALMNLRAAVNLKPRDPDFKAMLAWAIWRDTSLGLRARAVRVRRLLGEVLGRNPTCAQAYRVHAFVYADLGEIDPAIRCFAKVVELVPNDREAAEEMRRLERKRQSIFSRLRKNSTRP